MGSDQSVSCIPNVDPNEGEYLIESPLTTPEKEEREKEVISLKFGTTTLGELKMSNPVLYNKMKLDSSSSSSNYASPSHGHSDSILSMKRSALMRSRRNIVMSKRGHMQDASANLYETFFCDHCKLQIKSPNITICEMCNYEYGLCVICAIDNVVNGKAYHRHEMIAIPNTFYKPYDIFLKENYLGKMEKYTRSIETMLLLAQHPLTTNLKVQRKKDHYRLTFENRMYYDEPICAELKTYAEVRQVQARFVEEPIEQMHLSRKPATLDSCANTPSKLPSSSSLRAIPPHDSHHHLHLKNPGLPTEISPRPRDTTNSSSNSATSSADVSTTASSSTATTTLSLSTDSKHSTVISTSAAKLNNLIETETPTLSAPLHPESATAITTTNETANSSENASEISPAPKSEVGEVNTVTETTASHPNNNENAISTKGEPVLEAESDPVEPVESTQVEEQAEAGAEENSPEIPQDESPVNSASLLASKTELKSLAQSPREGEEPSSEPPMLSTNEPTEENPATESL